MAQPKTERELIEPRSPAAWREWLVEHHAASPGVFLVVQKKGSDEPGVRYEEAVEEALCFGWIDSTARALDGRRYRQLFTPRKPGGTWASSNKERVEKLIEQGRMTDAGYAAIDAAKRDGSWDALEGVDELAVPDDLALALASRPRARENFDTFSESARKTILWWISSAKRQETRQARIHEAARMAEKGLRAQLDRDERPRGARA